ncbi:MAG: hypothetical protein A2268_07445 [Candidatus Raymondbacteria bacterium RifOxyA12_full_50_37]|uniref:DUF4325 domain-containing protein n=1 Tax=Candidatus Raymondbacteria bacterium RIFOXYD12_FULL_49_13 TaxID=1817890 RepID=A0A1F7F614_UNCRA|nr:MAG: hypothetical protein A2350_09180 [Candidatus Raymondbacteria bacterium RifOxyB12_full_50_8]OGJ89808.1 MAG: hypothetical protein A2268_07445 [Candidatus Raymondbacteria bacterium RifOxyA12_full_50_37]OGJ91216.1 MAG: hypothetical protein A2248_01590 [Candidatus Raymondbacteria bacterium RIFOXYA2_FULL_49_16]OGJ96148.1 MAG: hypothetical protein A2487_01525 [Candidatus Raymondbacteria bacterium RifOxyC12_full_50_8]OGJ97614.1 MAG: hypothetical protein A2453_02355 [Candidatus Raymondbacteria b
MKIQVGKFGTMLFARPAGKEAFLALQPLLRGMDDSEEVVVDFSDVAVMTPSWADEFVTPLRSQFQGRVRLLNTENPSVKATLETLKKACRRP